MAEKLEVDPVALQVGSDQMLDAVDDAALDFLRQDDSLASAAPGWIGASQAVLGAITARWQVRQTQHTANVARLGQHVTEAGIRYVANEERSAQAIQSLACPAGN